MATSRKLRDFEIAPQTTIPGAVGTVFNPRDAKTGRAVPTDGRCCCGSESNHVEQEGDELVRVCNACNTTISSVRPLR